MDVITYELDGMTLKVMFNYSPPEKGTRDSMGVPLEPDWDEEIEICAVYCTDDILSLIDQDLINKITDHISEERGYPPDDGI